MTTTVGNDQRPAPSGAAVSGHAGLAPTAVDPGRPTTPSPPSTPGATDPVCAHPVLRRTLTWVTDAPDAPLLLVVCGPGGTGKSAALIALRAAYRSTGTTVVTVRGRAGVRLADLQQAGDRPVLVDDAHLLPADVLAWLTDRADDPTGRLVLATRPWPRPTGLDDLVHEADARAAVVELGPLDRSGVAALATHRLGRTPPSSLVDHLTHLTAGQPRLVELVLSGGSTERVTAASGTPLPPALLARLDADLGPARAPGRSVVLALALGGSALPAVLSPALGLSPDEVADALQGARAAGLLRDDGTVVPVVGEAVLAACPADGVRSVLEALLRAETDRGHGPTEVVRRFGGAPVRSAALATALREAGEALRATDPARAAALLGAAVDAGDPDPRTAVRQAECAGLAGDLTGALATADAVLRAGTGPASAPAVGVAAAVLAHRGRLRTAATLYAGIGVRDATTSDGAAAVVVVAAGGTGTTATGPGSPAARDTGAAQGTTVHDAASGLLAQGVRESVVGDGRRCLATLAQASVLLGDDARSTLLPETPAALGALAALGAGEPGHAERVLHQALVTGEGGPVAQPRHHLLLAWTAMLGGRGDESREHLARAASTGMPGAERDDLMRHAVTVGLARRSHDLGALAREWPVAWEALLRHGVDLTALQPLGELVVAAARLDRSHAVAPQLQDARDLLARLREPALWAAPLHWAGVRAAIVAERPEAVGPHAAALVQGAAVSRYAAMLADAGRVWVQVLAGRIETTAVERAARRLHAAGLGWDGARLAAHAATRTDDQRSGGQLMQLARDLHRGADRAAAPGDDPVLRTSSPPVGAPSAVGPAARDGLSTATGPTGAAVAAAAAVTATATVHAAVQAAVQAPALPGPSVTRRADPPPGPADAADPSRPATSAASSGSPARWEPDAATVPAGRGAASTASPPRTARGGAARARTGGSAAPEPAIHLSDREIEVARLVVAGHTYREISERLYISPGRSSTTSRACASGSAWTPERPCWRTCGCGWLPTCRAEDAQPSVRRGHGPCGLAGDGEHVTRAVRVEVAGVTGRDGTPSQHDRVDPEGRQRGGADRDLDPHGRDDPVMKPSMSPETASTPTSPIATVNSARPSSASARARGRRPGSTQVQNRRSPAAPATNTAVSSSRPCGAMRDRKMSSRPSSAIIPPVAPTITALLARTYSGQTPLMPRPTHCAAIQALLVHTIAAKPAEGS